MKILTILLILTLSSLSLAGPGGGHSHGNGHSHVHVTKEKTIELGRLHIQRLVKSKKIDASWLKSKFDKSKKVKNEWLVTFVNEKSSKGRVLYIFLKMSGEFVAANFSGK